MSVPCFHPSFGVSAKDKAKVGTFLSYLRFWNYILSENFQGSRMRMFVLVFVRGFYRT